MIHQIIFILSFCVTSFASKKSSIFWQVTIFLSKYIEKVSERFPKNDMIVLVIVATLGVAKKILSLRNCSK